MSHASREHDIPLTVAIIKSKDGGYLAYVEEWPGCVAQGETEKEAEENIADVVEAYFLAMIQRRRRTHTSPDLCVGFSGTSGTI